MMISLVLMCIISLCVAKAQQGKGAQMYSPTGDVPGRQSRNYITNVQVQRTTKEIDFGVKNGPPGNMVEFKPNYEDSAPRKSAKSRYADKSTLEHEKRRKPRPSRRSGDDRKKSSKSRSS